MKQGLLVLGWLFVHPLLAAPQFNQATPDFQSHYALNGPALCATAKQTLAYLNKGSAYDPQVIHSGKLVPISLDKVKATLSYLCEHQSQLNDPVFIKKHFNFIRWYPDVAQAKSLATTKPLLQNIPNNRILMTKYYVHLAQASATFTPSKPYPLYALPQDEQQLTIDEANSRPTLTRFQYGKQRILTGALNHLSVPKLAYLSRSDLEAALLQGTVVADFGSSIGKKTFNVHRNNNKPYDRTKSPYAQERYWYFKPVDGIKGYGKDAEYKITVHPQATFAADLTQLGLGKLLMIQYATGRGKTTTKAGILADTGGAFVDNLYQVDYLAGSFENQHAFNKATRALPDYVAAYFMVLK